MARAIEAGFGVQPDLSNIRQDDYEGSHNRKYGYIFFEVDGAARNVYFCQFNSVHGGERDGTNNDTIHSGVSPKAVDTLRRIGAYFGGWLDENDCDEKPDVFIEQSSELLPITNKQKLYSLFAREFGYRKTEDLIKAVQTFKAEILECNFGENSEV